MNGPDAELQNIAKDYGGIFDPSTLPGSLKEAFEDISTSAITIVDGLRKHMKPAWANRPFRMAFVDDSKTVNAFAHKGDFADYVIVTVPLVEQIFGTMNGMMCVPSVLPKIGASDREELPDADLSGGFPVMPLAADRSSRPLVPFFCPADHGRRVLSHMLASAALDFLIAHEVGHIVGGHLDMLERRGLAPTIREFGYTGSVNAIPEDHVLECDADTFAAHIRSFVDLRPTADSYWGEAFGWTGIPGKEAGFIFHASAVSILFRLLDALQGDEQPPINHEYSTHPHPAVRSNMAISRSFSLAVMAGRFTLDDLSHVIEASIWPIEAAWQELHLPGQRLGPRTEWVNQISRLSDELSVAYENSQATLDEFARVYARWRTSWPSFE